MLPETESFSPCAFEAFYEYILYYHVLSYLRSTSVLLRDVCGRLFCNADWLIEAFPKLCFQPEAWYKLLLWVRHEPAYMKPVRGRIFLLDVQYPRPIVQNHDYDVIPYDIFFNTQYHENHLKGTVWCRTESSGLDSINQFLELFQQECQVLSVLVFGNHHNFSVNLYMPHWGVH